MSDTTPSTEPVKDGRKWDHLTPEQRAFRVARMQAGRKKKEPAPAEVLGPDPKDAEIAALKAKLEAFLNAVQRQEETAASIATADAMAPLTPVECYFEYPGERFGDGLRRISDPEDPAWDALANSRRRISAGSFIINELQRAKSGEIIGRKQVTGVQESPNAARERMRRFYETGNHVIKVTR